MGTRADFYVGLGPQAEYLGSIEYDGHPTSRAAPLFNRVSDMAAKYRCAHVRVCNEAAYRAVVDRILHDAARAGRHGFRAWPWCWPDSRTTDFAYTWTPRGVRLSHGGSVWTTFTSYVNGRTPKDNLTDVDVVKHEPAKMVLVPLWA